MKKFALFLFFAVSVTLVFGQKNVRQSASNYLKDGKLDKAMEAINQCILDPSTAQDAKAWFLRGNIYLELSNTQDVKFKALDPDPLTKALESYKKAVEFDTKKEYYDDIVAKLNWQRNNYYNAAVDNYNKKMFKDAMINFSRGAEVLEMANVPDTVSLLNAATCASLANEKEAAKDLYLKLLKLNYKSPQVFITISDIYRQDKDSVNALKFIKMGQQLYPSDFRLFLSETNIYLTFNRTEKALDNLKFALKQDSTNSSVAFALGTIYDNLSNDTTRTTEQRAASFENAVDTYKNAIRLNPDYFDAIYNLGAIYVNKAAVIEEEANKLPLDATAKYEQLKSEANTLLSNALPYLEKATILQPTDINTLVTLKQIYARTNQNDKVKAIQEKINELKK
ncbi:MAG: tetratricopeptide repeat protein [Alphaproteobacteria bacterium]|nr:tetratricopeptide repeat protein [Alphaproteobacteria bacterium]